MALGITSAIVVLALLIVPLFEARDIERRSASRNNLKGIGLALHNYHAVYQLLPAGGIFNAREIPFFGWPVSIMPFMASGPEYDMIDFNVPWSDPKNADVFRRPYPWYLNPSIPQTTDNQGFVLTHYAANDQVLFPNSSMSFDNISDGLSQTILAGEIADGFLPYAQPGNWRDPAIGINAGARSFGRPTGEGALMLMADGRVVLIPNAFNPKLLRAMSTPAGGDKIPEVDHE